MASNMRHKKMSRFGIEGSPEIDFKNLDLLGEYVTETGKIGYLVVLLAHQRSIKDSCQQQ